ncbi:hypothetical protein DMENIID0001_055780 [Sergentomyia squamirostris]
MAMLRSRTVETGSGCHQVAARVTQGCPQGGVLSPLLWSLVVDELLVELSDHGMTAVGYADDLAIMVKKNDRAHESADDVMDVDKSMEMSVGETHRQTKCKKVRKTDQASGMSVKKQCTVLLSNGNLLPQTPMLAPSLDKTKTLDNDELDNFRIQNQAKEVKKSRVLRKTIQRDQSFPA